MSDEVRRQVRREIARLRLGTDQPVACAVCGETEDAELQRVSRRLVEFHHLAGAANDGELGVFLCLTHHARCTELMRQRIPLGHTERRCALERAEAALRGQAIYHQVAGPILKALAEEVADEIRALDRHHPGWRDLGRS